MTRSPGLLRQKGIMGSNKQVDMSQDEAQIKVVKAQETQDSAAKDSQKTEDKQEKQAATSVTEDKTSAPAVKVAKKQHHWRSKKYQAIRAQLDKTKLYEPAEAIQLVKKLSYSKFTGSVEAHLIVKEVGMSAEVTLPHSTGKTVKVAIVNDQLLKKIEAGEIDFDILLSSPEFMPKLAKLARILGPKGLMPNPKNGTLTPKPELKKKSLEAGGLTLKTEKKAPLIHLVIGKTDMTDKQLTDNLLSLIKAFKDKLVKVSIAASMSPGIKVNFDLESR